jgi:hypothetical protein
MKRKDVQKDKYYVVNCVTGKIKTGPYDTEKEAERNLPERDPYEEFYAMSGDDFLDES